MDNQDQGEELNQLSKLLFNKAVRFWCWSISLEFIGCLAGILISFLTVHDNILRLSLAFIILLILGLSYFLRIRFKYLYGNAETMRRQSVLAEALSWPIGATQFSDWRLKAGRKILNSFKLKPRDKDYYTTHQMIGSRKLLEMTIESAFFTRHFYNKIAKFIWTISGSIIIITFLVLGIIPIGIVPVKTRLDIIYILYLLLPLIISFDFIGWGIKLNKIINSMKEIEKDMERLEKKTDLDISEVMRLVSEYNCQIVEGFPIPEFIFKLWHNEVLELWERRII